MEKEPRTILTGILRDAPIKRSPDDLGKVSAAVVLLTREKGGVRGMYALVFLPEIVEIALRMQAGSEVSVMGKLHPIPKRSGSPWRVRLFSVEEILSSSDKSTKK